MPKINRETYDKATIDISDNDNLNSFVLAIKIIEDVANEIQPYMVYENFNEISVAIGEYIGIEVYTEKILITENGDTVEHKVSDLSEDMKKVFENINFTDWRMYGIADFNYAKHTFLKNVSDKEVLLKMFIPRTDIRILEGSIEVKSVDNIDEIISAVEKCTINSTKEELKKNTSQVDLEKLKSIDSEYYKEIVSKGIEEINNDKYDKVILSRKIKLEKKILLKDSFLLGRKYNTPARSYCLKIGDVEVIGFSPETVVEVDEEKKVYTFPLAGTRALTDDPIKNKELKCELLKDPKEIAEHAVSVKLAFEELEKVCIKDSISVVKFMEVLERVQFSI